MAALSWAEKEAAAVDKLVSSLPPWEGSLARDTPLPIAASFERGTLKSGVS